MYPKKIEQNGFVDIFTGKTDNSGTIIENVESNGVHAKEGFCLLIDIFKLVFCLVVLLVIGIVVFLVKWVLDGGLFFIEIVGPEQPVSPPDTQCLTPGTTLQKLQDLRS